MKKIFVLLLCLTLVCVLPLVAYAEDDTAPSPETEGTSEEMIGPSLDDSTAEPETEGAAEDEKEETATPAEIVVAWIEENIAGLTMVVTTIGSVFYQIRKHAALNKSIGTLNNNAVTVAENSATSIQQALLGMTGVANVVTEYKEKITELLEAYKQTAADKQSLEARLAEFDTYLKNAKSANVELSNEVAELLVLANIPNAKKDELYSRHRAAVALFDEAEVKVNEGREE